MERRWREGVAECPVSLTGTGLAIGAYTANLTASDDALGGVTSVVLPLPSRQSLIKFRSARIPECGNQCGEERRPDELRQRGADDQPG